MTLSITRRTALAGGILLAAALPALPPAFAQDKPKLRFSAVFSEQDIRAEMMKHVRRRRRRATSRSSPIYGGNLFKQGTELVALQRGNLEMGNIAPQDISNQIPAWSILTSAYLFRDADHLQEVLRQRRRRRDEEDGRGPARHPHPRARPISARARSA